MFAIFIRRPVLSIVISLFITFLGLLALTDLPVTQFPEIVPPSVTVTARYTGANAEVCAKAVATPIEKAINGVPGMTYLSSVCSNNGTTIITVNFKVGTDPDIAAVGVQNRVQAVIAEMPEEVIRAGITTEKDINSMLMYLNILSEDTTMDEKFVFNYTDINVLAELKRIDGVGFAVIMGEQDYSMRIWLKPDRMAGYEVSTQDIIEAIKNQNIEAAPGKSGESSGKEVQMLQYVLRYTGKFFDPKQYENLVVKANPDGSMIKIKDIAEVEFGSLSYNMISKNNGKPSASIMLKQRPGSNAREVIQNVKNKMEELQKNVFPPGMKYNITYDVSRFLDASIHEVVRTLFEAFLLVSIVVFLFLQDFRSTIIPAIAVPVSLIGAFFFMQIFGFSINLLTLFALVLAIGIVVDDAIVVVEAVHAKMSEKHLPPKEATMEAMKEISGAILAITLVMTAVFIPVSFMSGPVGIFYRQFSLTLAIAIIISGINALTLTPALCAMLLKPHESHGNHQTFLSKFFAGFNHYYEKLAGKYKWLLDLVAGRRMVTLATLIIFIAMAWGMSNILPTGFIPTEDQGVIYINVTTPVGATVERTDAILNKITEITDTIKSIQAISTLAGYSLITESAGASYGMGMIDLKSWDDRKDNVKQIIEKLEEGTKDISDAKIEFFPPPTVPGFGNSSGFEFRIQDRTGSGDLQRTSKVTNEFIATLNSSPIINNSFTIFDASFPQYLIHIDQDLAAQKGITINNAMSTLQTLIGSYYASNFIRFGLMYKVMVQAAPRYRARPEDIAKLYVKNSRGEMVAFSSFVRLERVYGPEQLTRYNMYTSAMVNGEPAKGYSSGEAIEEIKKVAKEKLPKGFSYDWTGMTREEILSGNQAIYIFMICLLFVYLLLSAQYESFILPIPVILSLPIGIFGALFSLGILGLENNIYAQVSLVMLIGLLGKNAILIIEFALQRQKEGLSVRKAAIEGALARFRPILMTSFAFIAGLIPLVIATGAGAVGNRTIGTAAAGGMLFGTVFGLIVIPGLYILFASLLKINKKPRVIEEFETQIQ
ncbi:MAG: efflux RND transporter permease subunit [Cytophagales bacterium]|nr:MAG: efflux RND transporter permease subunit [Cytophagales bacterium]